MIPLFYTLKSSIQIEGSVPFGSSLGSNLLFPRESAKYCSSRKGKDSERKISYNNRLIIVWPSRRMLNALTALLTPNSNLSAWRQFTSPFITSLNSFPLSCQPESGGVRWEMCQIFQVHGRHPSEPQDYFDGITVAPLTRFHITEWI